MSMGKGDNAQGFTPLVCVGGQPLFVAMTTVATIRPAAFAAMCWWEKKE
jgi:hypothetical protein